MSTKAKAFLAGFIAVALLALAPPMGILLGAKHALEDPPCGFASAHREDAARARSFAQRQSWAGKPSTMSLLSVAPSPGFPEGTYDVTEDFGNGYVVSSMVTVHPDGSVSPGAPLNNDGSFTFKMPATAPAPNGGSVHLIVGALTLCIGSGVYTEDAIAVIHPDGTVTGPSPKRNP